MVMGFNLVDALQRITAANPGRPAMHCGEDTFSFREFEDRVARVSRAMADRGVGFGDRIAVLSGNCHRYAELYWVGAFLGAVVVPLEARLTEEDMRFILDEVQPKVVVGDSVERAQLLHSLADSSSLAVVMQGDCSGTELTSYESLVASGAGKPDHTDVSPDAAVAIFYTAAVDGKPKGAVVTHRNLTCQAVQTAGRVGMTVGDSHGVFLPLSHTFGAYLMFVAACNGAASALLPVFDAQGAAELIDAGKVTFFAEFAPMAERIWQAAESSGVALASKLRFVVGLDLPPAIEKYLEAGIRFWCLYGQTETAGLVAMGELFPGSVVANYSGTPLDLTNISLRDDQGNPVSEGEAGEAWVRSDCVVTRYWPDLPTRLNRNGWLQTGDILRCEPGQRFYFVGRKGDKDLIKPGGLNVYPAEVEQVLCRHEMVRAAFVFGAPDPLWRERVCAVVVPEEGSPDGLADALRGICENQLASYKRPAVLIVASELVGGSATLTRDLVRERFLDRVSGESIAPKN